MVCLALSAHADAADNVLVPNYDIPERQLKFFDDRIPKPFMLNCNITVKGDYKLSWSRNGTDVSKDPVLIGRYEIIDKEHKFIIPKPDVTDAGNYTCSVPELGKSADIQVIANVYFKKVPDSINVVEGQKLEIHCKTFGSSPKITWSVGGNDTFDRERIILKTDSDNVEDAILFINNTVLEDRKWYNCTATNLASELAPHLYKAAHEQSYVRVKGKLAALWPFLGICAEVFVLCAIILIYEKRRNKTDLEESDTDQSPEQEKLKSGK